MAIPLRRPNLTAYDAQLLELAQQLDAERREIVMKFAQDLLPPMVTSNSPACGHPNSPRQDGLIMGYWRPRG